MQCLLPLTRYPLPLSRVVRSSRAFTCCRVASNAVTKVEKLLLDHIKATGPLPIATYMQLSLSHPTHGYYMNQRNPIFGKNGDFITSPEISQVFGELVAIWLLSQWQNAGKPPSIRLVELGPGRGTLVDDILRVIAKFTSQNDIQLHLVETSQALRAIQKEKIQPKRENMTVQWHDSITDIPPPTSSQYTMLVAHEFFDALPIHVLQRTETGWHEVLVDSAHTTTNKEQTPSQIQSQQTPRLRRVLSPTPSAASTVLGLSSPRFKTLPIGSSIEVSPASFKIARQLGELLSGGKDFLGGCGLIIDYGGNNVFGNSFRAFKDHKVVDVFYQPGECDLTANVDFSYLHEAMSDLVETHGPISQHDFLEHMGLGLRVHALMKAAKEERASEILKAANRLMDQTGMGKQYQVMGITSKRERELDGGVGGEDGFVWPFVSNKGESSD